ncbi:class I SAM-dependent methyltransferase [Geminocystis sp. CENA526]|uniref:class I SAM-dependent methyltransferase n=1 Tax=Geminocystis sp. CENA526 TaxID=1355871 RepID=UPI003D6DC0E3
MTEKEILSKIKGQYENLPYPNIPIEKTADDDYNALFVHDLRTSYYLAFQEIIDLKNTIILDAGCGSGWKSLVLAYANPNAKIIGVDLSPKSVEIAQARFEYHGLTNGEFYALNLEDLPSLNYQFDYINCDEVIYLLPEPEKGLKILQSVLKERGILRTNFHNYYQRFSIFTIQKLFRTLGLMEESPDDLEVEIVKDTFTKLKNNIGIKAQWNNIFTQFSPEKQKSSILMNYLLESDKGFTIPDVFAMLNNANLKFLSMTDWRSWNIQDLFEELPEYWEMGLENISQEEELNLYDLLNPIHRLIDFWCVNNQTSLPSLTPVSAWNDNDWDNAIIYVHPQLKTDKIKQDLLRSIEQQQSFIISKYITLTARGNIELESNMTACLLCLWEKETNLQELVNRWLKIQPLNLLTFEEMTYEEAKKQVINTLIKLENFLYILIEQGKKSIV